MRSREHMAGLPIRLRRLDGTESALAPGTPLPELPDDRAWVDVTYHDGGCLEFLETQRRRDDPEPQHRWSGWPGAYCLGCGAEDRRETVCCLEHDVVACAGTPECINEPCPNP